MTITVNCECCEGKNKAPIDMMDVWFCTKRKAAVAGPGFPLAAPSVKIEKSDVDILIQHLCLYL